MIQSFLSPTPFCLCCELLKRVVWQRARKGIFITTSSFSKDAIDYAKGVTPKIVLMDGRKLADLMVEHDVGVSKVGSYEVKKIDMDFFTES